MYLSPSSAIRSHHNYAQSERNSLADLEHKYGTDRVVSFMSNPLVCNPGLFAAANKVGIDAIEGLIANSKMTKPSRAFLGNAIDHLGLRRTKKLMRRDDITRENLHEVFRIAGHGPKVLSQALKMKQYAHIPLVMRADIIEKYGKRKAKKIMGHPFATDYNVVALANAIAEGGAKRKIIDHPKMTKKAFSDDSVIVATYLAPNELLRLMDSPHITTNNLPAYTKELFPITSNGMRPYDMDIASRLIAHPGVTPKNIKRLFIYHTAAVKESIDPNIATDHMGRLVSRGHEPTPGLISAYHKRVHKRGHK